MTSEEAAREAKQQMLARMTPEERADYTAKAQLSKMAGGGGFQNSGLDLEEVSEFRGKDAGHHASRGMKQARLAADARASIQQRLAALLSGTKKAAVDVEVGDLLVEDELPMAGGGPTRFKQLRPKKTEEQKAAERAASLAAARSKAQLEDLMSSVMGFSQEDVAAAEALRKTEVARLQAELEAMGAVDWEQAADGLRIITPSDSDEEIAMEDL